MWASQISAYRLILNIKNFNPKGRVAAILIGVRADIISMGAYPGSFNSKRILALTKTMKLAILNKNFKRCQIVNKNDNYSSAFVSVTSKCMRATRGSCDDTGVNAA